MFVWLIFVDEQNLQHFDANREEFYRDKMKMYVPVDWKQYVLIVVMEN
jgi:hypothetical protein